jgi:peptidoglycan/xylan/chitin deacetylase (PgdA/CDA1 family)
MRGRESILIVLKAAIVALIACTAAAKAEECSRKDALGTARVLAVDPAAYPRVGVQSFPQTLPLEDKEVVLTFDDGPHGPTTTKILAALSRECVHATFFLIGQHAAANPALVRRIAAEGHTVAHHSWSHPDMGKISNADAIDQIDRGIAADQTALQGKPAGSVPSTPFFRFPYFSSTPALLDVLQSRGIAVFGADFWASDWNKMTPAQELKLVTDRLEVARKGIILFHDPKEQTAAMMPDFLRYLREHQYRVVHIVAAAAGKSARTSTP